MILAELPVTTELIALLIQYTNGIGNISNSFIYKRNYLNCPKDLLKLISFFRHCLTNRKASIWWINIAFRPNIKWKSNTMECCNPTLYFLRTPTDVFVYWAEMSIAIIKGKSRIRRFALEFCLFVYLRFSSHKRMFHSHGDITITDEMLL